MDPLTAGVVVLAVVVVLLIAACAGIYRRLRELELATYHGVGMRFGTGQGGQTLSGFGTSGGTTFVLKINRQCPVCDELLVAVNKFASDLPEGYSLTVLSDDPRFDKKVPAEVSVIRDSQVWRSVTVPYTPALLVVDEQGTVAFTTPVGSGEALVEVVERVVARREEVRT